jgi:hypothetical protein
MDLSRLYNPLWMRRFNRHPDPLVEANNWRAFVIGTHLPLWPVYVIWSAGWQAWPSSLLTMLFTPIFLIVPALSRRSDLGGRIAMVLFGVANTVFTIWILGANTGTSLFFIPCAVLAAMTFRYHERWLMLASSLLPLLVWYLLRMFPLPVLHHYDDGSARNLFLLNAVSIGLLIAIFGWFQVSVYQHMEGKK